MIARCRLILNRSTARKDVFDQGSGGLEFHPGAAHAAQKRLAFFVDKIHFAKVEDGLAPHGRGSGSLPALTEFLYPKTRQFSLQPQSKLAGCVVKRDLEHTRQSLGHAVCHEENYLKSKR
jgi:hypothetical protein